MDRAERKKESSQAGFRIGMWNVKTLLKVRKLKELIIAMRKIKLDNLAVRETR